MRVSLIAGGNLGDVRAALERACEQVEQRVGNVVAKSAVYESPAWGFEAVERFLNQVWIVETELEPERLLDVLEETERSLGRLHKGGQYRSRTMDIDILFYGQQIVRTPRLSIPHPLMQQRRFVLEPLGEVAPEWVHPVSGKSVNELLDSL